MLRKQGMFDETRLNRIRIWMDRYVDQRKYAGSSFLLKHKGDEVFFHSSGLRNLEEALPFQRDTLVRIYSMTKPVTSVALMMLAERGIGIAIRALGLTRKVTLINIPSLKNS